MRRAGLLLQVHQYMSTLPESKVPLVGSVGEKYRVRQLLRQLPPHDNDARYCSGLGDDERTELRLFNARRKRSALGRGSVRLLPDSLADALCHQVGQPRLLPCVSSLAARAFDLRLNGLEFESHRPLALPGSNTGQVTHT